MKAGLENKKDFSGKASGKIIFILF